MFENLLSSEMIHILAPLVFIFAVVYGSLDISGVFKNRQGVNVVIALIIAIVSVSNKNVVELLWKYMPIASVVFAIAFILGFIWKLVKNLATDVNDLKSKNAMNKDQFYGMMGVILFMILIGLQSDTITNIVKGFGIDKTTMIFIVGVIIIGGLFFVANMMGMFSNKD